MKLIKLAALVVLWGAVLGLWQAEQKELMLSGLDKKITTPTDEPKVETREIIIPTEELKAEPTKKQITVPTKKPSSPTVTPTPDNEPWGVAKQIDEVTWTMKVGDDEKMATVEEILAALNTYRQRYGHQVLIWDNKLGDYAKSRAVYLNNIKGVDKHEGFNNYLEKEDGFDKLGFTTLGENISYGYRLNGVHIIEWMYAGDKPHNDNQLDNRWNYVGIGVDGLATCLIFGTGKI